MYEILQRWDKSLAVFEALVCDFHIRMRVVSGRYGADLWQDIEMAAHRKETKITHYI